MSSFCLSQQDQRWRTSCPNRHIGYTGQNRDGTNPCMSFLWMATYWTPDFDSDYKHRLWSSGIMWTALVMICFPQKKISAPRVKLYYATLRRRRHECFLMCDGKKNRLWKTGCERTWWKKGGRCVWGSVTSAFWGIKKIQAGMEAHTLSRGSCSAELCLA